MSCPSCGNGAYQLVAPGVGECTAFLMRPTGAHPSGALGPTQTPVPCGRRYQVPNPMSDMPPCSEPCGMQSLARCVVCQAPLCLDHAVRFSDGVVCPRHAAERNDAAANAETGALLDAETRLRGLMRGFPAAISDRAPELHLEHVLLGDVRGVREGDVCAQHGPPCRAAQVLTRGRVLKKVYSVHMHMDAWVLRHMCKYGHADLHTGPRRTENAEVDLVVIASTGEIYHDTCYFRPVDLKGIRYSIGGTGADDPGLVDTLRRSMWPYPNLSRADNVRDLADRIERILSGPGHLGSEPCGR